MGGSKRFALTRDLGFQAWSFFPHGALLETPHLPTCDELTLLLALTRLLLALAGTHQHFCRRNKQ